MKAIFKVGDKDFTRFLEEGGIKWSRNDVDSELTKRSKLTAKMYRKRLATKRKLSITCKRMTTAEVHELNQAILPEKISVTYLDTLEGQVVTKEFYGSSVDATTQISMGDETYWDGVGFNIIEM